MPCLKIAYVCIYIYTDVCVKPKDRKPSLSGKNDHNALWHVKICHDAEVVLWMLKDVTITSSDFMKIPQGVVVVTFYSHDAM